MKDLAKLLAYKFIARPDIKAVQRPNGDYNPIEAGFKMDDLLAHLQGAATYGHYMLNTDNQCKLFAFDIDLDKIDKKEDGTVIKDWYVPTTQDEYGVWGGWIKGDPRELWADRSQRVARAFYKQQLKSLAAKLARSIHRQLEIPCAVTYTGAKGVHVYGFTGLMNAEDVRKGAQLVIEELGTLEPYKGNNFYKYRAIPAEDGSYDPEASFEGLTIEVFPKQTDLKGKTHGNLMRLPLGRNLKNPKDPTFFLDMRTNFGEGAFIPRDPKEALTVEDQWA